MIPRDAVNLTGKTAVVTGGASGLGAAIAAGMAAAGARVLIVDRNGVGLEEVAGQIAAVGGVCSRLELDLADPAAPARIVEVAVEQFASLDVLVLCAGIHEQAGFEAMSRESFEHVFAGHTDVVPPGDPARWSHTPFAGEIVNGTPLRRLGRPEDIVAPALFLASDGARHVHGATIVVDGGFTVL